ncbi:homoserine acetyltransferase family protein [Xylariales sp. PMI_506]|nr:homoserine acetyltransferase family protein [Xylariales sp. PMI_506]
MAAPIQYFELPNFTFEDGTTLPVAKLAYLDINPSGSKVALIPTCFRGKLHATLTFATGALRDYRIIVVALFGNGESSSPSNHEGATPFPKLLDYRDCVRAQHELLTKNLGVQTIDLMAGFSMAGQCTYYWAATHPDMVRNAVMICSSARTSKHNRQFLEGPRAALENSVDYAGGDGGAAAATMGKHEAPRGVHAFAKAYSAWLTSADWFEQELWRDLGYASYEEWDTDSTGPRYAGWYPNDLLAKLRMWQRGDVTVCDPSAAPSSSSDSTAVADTLSKIKARVLLMPSRTDQYFRWEASERELKYLQRGTLVVIPSVWGHLAGSGISPTDVAWMDQQIHKFIQEA